MVKTLIIGTNKPEQTVKTKIRCLYEFRIILVPIWMFYVQIYAQSILQ